MARLKISISLENFKILNFFKIWALRVIFTGGPVLGSEKKHIKKKTRKQNFHGIVPGFWGEFCLCFFLPHKE